MPFWNLPNNRARCFVFFNFFMTILFLRWYRFVYFPVVYHKDVLRKPRTPGSRNLLDGKMIGTARSHGPHLVFLYLSALWWPITISSTEIQISLSLSLSLSFCLCVCLSVHSFLWLEVWVVVAAALWVHVRYSMQAIASKAIKFSFIHISLIPLWPYTT